MPIGLRHNFFGFNAQDGTPVFVNIDHIVALFHCPIAGGDPQNWRVVLTRGNFYDTSRLNIELLIGKEHLPHEHT
jgi:hypothetical protein